MPQPKPHLLTPEEYLQREEDGPIRHEFVAGEVYAMSGGTLVHNEIALNLAVWLRNHLSGQPCKVYINDVLVRAAASDAYYYPDLVVRCGADLPPEARVIDDPLLVIEVLSKGTRGTGDTACDAGKSFST